MPRAPTLPRRSPPRIRPSDESTFWENVAQSAWGKYISAIERDALLRAHQLAQRPGAAFEIGTEGGRWCKMLAGLGWRMRCSEVDPRSLRICKAKVPSAKCILVRKDETHIPSESATMNLLVCIEVAPVIKSDWFPQEACRILRDDGLLVGVFFNLLSYRGMIAHVTAALRHSYDYYETTYISWKRKLETIGFSFLHEVGICWFPFRRASNSALIPVCCSMERQLGLQDLPAISPWVVFVARKNQTN